LFSCKIALKGRKSTILVCSLCLAQLIFKKYILPMRVVVQRVTKASVTINAVIKASIRNGLLVFVGIEDADNINDIEWLSNKIINLRIFDDENKVPNLSVQDIKGDILVISQFTLHAATKRGNRPSYIKASKPNIAIPLYEMFIRQLEKDFGKNIYTGEFGADMKVALLNDGPVTIWIDSKDRE
jgi:D-tyrosyl-tRNA(Tyr) deacylase